jgi:serine protease Do
MEAGLWASHALTRKRAVQHGPAMRIVILTFLCLSVPAFAAKPPPLGEDLSPPGKPAPVGQLPALRGPPPPEGRLFATGSGFIVGDGKILTNAHVVEGCSRMAARNAQGQRTGARVDAIDPRRDLALLSVPVGFGPVLVFRDSPPVQRGETVITYGFPLSGVLSSGPTLTTGDVSALAGLRDNPLHFQISAPVQPGNSGGPLLDLQGHVMGVVVSKLNAARIAKITGGDIPQNVNFAIKGPEAAAFLAGRGAPVQHAPSTGPELRVSEIGARVNASVVFMQCYK